MIRKIGVTIARHNIKICNGDTPNQFERIKISSFELTRITHEQDLLEDVKRLASIELKQIFNEGLIEISINQEKIVVILIYDAAISIYSEKYYPLLSDNDNSS